MANSLIRLEQPIAGDRPGLQLRATLLDADGVVSTASCTANVDFAPRLDLLISDERRRLWSPGNPHLYDLEIELIDSDGTTVDRATSYPGLRSVAIDGHAIRINGEVVFHNRAIAFILLFCPFVILSDRRERRISISLRKGEILRRFSRFASFAPQIVGHACSVPIFG